VSTERTIKANILLPLLMIIGVIAPIILMLNFGNNTLRWKFVAWRVRSLSAEAEIPDSRDKAIGRLLSYAQDDFSFGASYALDALGRIEGLEKPVIIQIAELLSSNDGLISREAALALCDIGPDCRVVAPQLIEYVRTGSTNDDSTSFSARALSHCGRDACEAIPILRDKMSQANPNFPAFRSYQKAIRKLEEDCGR
jgi:hypothetical protein